MANTHRESGSPVDIGAYIRSLAGTDDMFPITYKTQSEHAGGALDLKISDPPTYQTIMGHDDMTFDHGNICETSNDSGVSFGVHTDGNEAMGDKELVMTCIERAFKNAKESNEFPGSRALLVFSPVSNNVFVVDYNMAVTSLEPITMQHRDILHGWLCVQPGSTILEGIISTTNEFVWSDAIMLNGKVMQPYTRDDEIRSQEESSTDKVDSFRPQVSAWMMISCLDEIEFIDGWSIRT